MSESDAPMASDAEPGDAVLDTNHETSSGGIIRNEEELLIATELVETGRARLVKRVEVESVSRTIELRREVLEIERIDAVNGGDGAGGTPSEQGSGLLGAGSFAEGVVEIVLMQEEALISTQMVPRERILLSKRVVTEDRVVDADLRVERIDVEERPASAGDVS